MSYADLTAHQLLTIVREMGWRLTQGRGATLLPEPAAPGARAALPPDLLAAIETKRVPIRVLLAMESGRQQKQYATIGD